MDKQNNKNTLATTDIETITIPNFKSLQIPVAITLSYNSSNNIISKIFTINYNSLDLNSIDSINSCLDELWKEYFDFIINNHKHFKYIFAHNLGSFDGLFIYKALLNYGILTNIDTIIDDKNKFISIKYKVGKITIEWNR